MNRCRYTECNVANKLAAPSSVNEIEPPGRRRRAVRYSINIIIIIIYQQHRLLRHYFHVLTGIVVVVVAASVSILCDFTRIPSCCLCSFKLIATAFSPHF